MGSNRGIVHRPPLSANANASPTLQFIGALPGWLLWLGQAAYVVGALYAFGLFLGVGIFAHNRLELVRDMFLAAAFAVRGVFVLTWVIDQRWPESAFFDLHETRETFPPFFVTTSAAVQAAASPWLTPPIRKIGWAFILAAVGASVFGGVTTVSDAFGGLLVGMIAAAFIRYAPGTSAGLPSTNRIRAGLADLGVQVDTLTYFDEQPAASVVLSGTSTEGKALLVSGLGAIRGAPAGGRGCGGRPGIRIKALSTGPTDVSRSNTNR